MAAEKTNYLKSSFDTQYAKILRFCSFDKSQSDNIKTQFQSIASVLGPDKLQNLFQAIETIEAQIKAEKLPPDTKKILTDKIIKLSPKRTGTYLEVSCRGHNELTKATSSSHDAQNKNLEKIEIKASRVLIDKISEDKQLKLNENLYDEFLNEERTLANFSQFLTNTSYDCNIQQVKPKEFKELIYNVFLSEIILEFKISSEELERIHNAQEVDKFEKTTQNANLKVWKQIGEAIDYFSKKADKNAQELCKNLKVIQDTLSKAMGKKKYLLTLGECLDKFSITLTHEKDKIKLQKIKQEYCSQELVLGHFMRNMLSYSNKQHRGNVGEGQFHIHSANALYHLAQHFEAAYTYHDFVEKLKSQSIKNRKHDIIQSNNPKIQETQTHDAKRPPRQKSLW